MALLTLCDVNATFPLVMSRRVGSIGLDDGRLMIRRRCLLWSNLCLSAHWIKLGGLDSVRPKSSCLSEFALIAVTLVARIENRTDNLIFRR